MGKQFTRRNLLKFVGGSAAGVLLTPIPWKTLDDVAIWTQNWSWIPKPLRGEIQIRFTTCTLCPAACGVRVRCVGTQPVSLSGIAAHPVTRGATCPIGLGGHHLPYHPARLLQPVRMSREKGRAQPIPLSLDAAIAAIAGIAQETRAPGSKESVAVLDSRPGRTLSTIYRRFLGGLGNGVYLAPSSADGSGFETLRRMLPESWGEPGLDLADTATILSFGTPILDGWGTPGRIAAIARAHGDADDRRRLRIIQVESRRSRTAAAADLWVPINPGTEAALALGLAHVLIQEKLCEETPILNRAIDPEGSPSSSYRSLIQQFTPEKVARTTGVNAERIVGIARELVERTPAVVIGGGDPGGGPLGEEEERAICGLNLLLGSVGRRGGIVARREVPGDPALAGNGLARVSPIEDLPDQSIRLLVMDGAGSASAIPWKLLEQKLVPHKAFIVSISPVLAGDALRADLVIPAPAYMESLEEASVPIDSPVSTFSLSQPFQPPAAGAIEPALVIRRLASALSVTVTAGGEDYALAECLKRRVGAIYKSGRGGVFTPQDGKLTALEGMDSPDTLWKMLGDGGCWIDSDAEPKAPSRLSLLGKDNHAYAAMVKAGEGRLHAVPEEQSSYPLVLMPYGLRGLLDDAQVSPLMTKLYQESGLRRLLNQADINPATAGALGLADRAGALVETKAGSIRVEIRFDPGVMPGVIHVAVGPSGPSNSRDVLRDRQSILTICQADADPVWRVSRAKVREV